MSGAIAPATSSIVSGVSGSTLRSRDANLSASRSPLRNSLGENSTAGTSGSAGTSGGAGGAAETSPGNVAIGSAARSAPMRSCNPMAAGNDSVTAAPSGSLMEHRLPREGSTFGDDLHFNEPSQHLGGR